MFFSGFLHRFGTLFAAIIAGFLLVRAGAKGPQIVSNIGAGSPYPLDGLTWSSGMVTLIVVAVFALVSMRTKHSTQWWQWAAVATCGSAILVAYYSFPLTTSSSNSRIHWVDWRLVPDLRDDLRYLVTRLFRSTEWQVSHPWLVGASLSSLSILMVFIYGKREKWPIGVALIVSMALLFSGPLGLFINPSEDASTVFLVITATAVLMTFPRMRPIALVLPTLVRPEFITIWIAFIALSVVEYLASLSNLYRQRMEKSPPSWQILARALKTVSLNVKHMAIAGSIFVLLQFVLYDTIGRRWILINGQIIDESATAEAVPIEVDGWTISEFSGTYVLHFFWMFPPFLILALMSILFKFRGRKSSSRVAVKNSDEFDLERPLNMPNFLLLWSFTILLLHEARPIFYFNTRYLAYAILPALLAIGGVVARHLSLAGDQVESKQTSQNFAYLGALLTVFLLPTAHSDLREINLERDYASWVIHRPQLVEYGENTPVFSLDHRRTTRNSISYYFDVSVKDIRLINPDDLKLVGENDAVVVCFRDCDPLFSYEWRPATISGVYLRNESS